jgi:hypothetical protein
MDLVPSWLITRIEADFGAVVHLSGQPGVVRTRTWRVQSAFASVVVKQCDNREYDFYVRYAELLRGEGVSLPTVYWMGRDEANQGWLVLEDVSQPLDASEWLGSAEPLSLLVRLHAAHQEALPQSAYRPAWDERLSEQVLAWYTNGATRRQLASRLGELQVRAQELFFGRWWLSGDPNLTNWRVRRDGDAVLVDWERFCEGNPAIDLAILMPGVGIDGTTERLVAARYVELWDALRGGSPFSPGELVPHIRLAKIWSFVEFLANAWDDAAAASQPAVQALLAELPGLASSHMFR